MCHKQNIQSIARSIFFVDAHVPQQLFNISICRFDAYDYLCTQRIQCEHVHIFFAPIDSSKIFLESSGLYNQNYTHVTTRIRMYYRERNFSSSYIVDAKSNIEFARPLRFLKSVSLRSTSSMLTLLMRLPSY